MAAQLPADCYVVARPLVLGDVVWLPAASAALLSGGGSGTTQYGALAKTSKPGVTIAPVAGSGADFDAGTDSTTDGLQPAINYWGSTTTGGTILPYPGGYGIAASITVPYAGIGISALRAAQALGGTSSAPALVTGMVNFLDARAASTAAPFITVSAGGFSLEGITVYTTNAQSYPQLSLSSIAGADISRCCFTGNYQAPICIEMDSCANVYITRSAVGYCTGDAIYINSQAAPGCITVGDCDIRRYGYSGTSTSSGVHVAATGGGPEWIRHNNITNGPSGVYVDSTSTAVTSLFVDANTIFGPGSSGNYGVYVHGNASGAGGPYKMYFTGNLLGAWTYGYYIDGNVWDFAVTGGSVQDNYNDGIYLAPNDNISGGFSLAGVMVSGNGVSSSGSFAGLNIGAVCQVDVSGGALTNITGSTPQGYAVNFSTALASGVYQFANVRMRNNSTGIIHNVGNAYVGHTFFSDCSGYNPQAWATASPSLPSGTGSGNAVQNANPYFVRVYQTGESGTTIVSFAGTTKQLPLDTAFDLGPGDSVWYATTIPSSWLWYGL